jgi:hypothetical protein
MDLHNINTQAYGAYRLLRIIFLSTSKWAPALSGNFVERGSLQIL